MCKEKYSDQVESDRNEQTNLKWEDNLLFKHFYLHLLDLYVLIIQLRQDNCVCNVVIKCKNEESDD